MCRGVVDVGIVQSEMDVQPNEQQRKRSMKRTGGFLPFCFVLQKNHVNCCTFFAPSLLGRLRLILDTRLGMSRFWLAFTFSLLFTLTM
jgi:hypothetical protein